MWHNHPTLVADEIDDHSSLFHPLFKPPGSSSSHKLASYSNTTNPKATIPTSSSFPQASQFQRIRALADPGEVLPELHYKAQSPSLELPLSPYFESTSNFDTDLYPDDILESVYTYDSDSRCSPTLSNKGVPNMFPVTASDFTSEEREHSPVPYGSPLPSNKLLDSLVVQRMKEEEDLGNEKLGKKSPRVVGSPHSDPLTSPVTESCIFGFYHNDVRLGQTQQFGTFGRK